MIEGHFYFIKDNYFDIFNDPYLMKNKEYVNGQMHDRPCFYAFYDEKTKLYWMIPFSSQVSKFENIYNKKIEKYGFCDTIDFGDVLGHKKAFLIQNMCPITPEYINNEYFNNNTPVQIDGITEKRLLKKARKVLTLQRQGKKLIFPDVLKIEAELVKKD